MNAINDALRPFKARVAQMPFTPERILRAVDSRNTLRFIRATALPLPRLGPLVR